MKMKVKDAIILIGWLYSHEIIISPYKEFKYIKEYVSLNDIDLDFDVEYDEKIISNLLEDSYNIYLGTTTKRDDTLEKLKAYNLSNEKIKVNMVVLDEYRQVYEKILLEVNTNFEKRKELLNYIMKKSIENEDYEKCAIIRDKLKN